ncbi:hypothetical protein QFC21_003348 [Naganishia friedmannii]|uniref:Uncharacterized protein n=1 Tax=Naganishia friedmannii TaxID=89922 RepID=A0ACC2VQG5_9TREE|nr:hypothetical protein QFC21_003348 [Naganishia friedmannii]
MSSQIQDQATLSNYHEVRNLHTHLDWTIDWKEQLIGGTATLTMKPETDKPVEKVVLDTSYLDVTGVKVDGEKVEFKVEIKYSTTKECTALGWLTKDCLTNRLIIQADQRRKVPLPVLSGTGDTPSIKSAYSANVKSTIPALLSALRQSPPVDQPHGGKEIGSDVVEYVYDQPVPIPSYLIAIAAGNVVYKQFPRVEGRSWTAGVWTEPEGIDEAYWEFSEDIGRSCYVIANGTRYISIAEDLTTPYTWGVYDTLVLPPSFPYGGRKLLRDALKEMPPKYQKLVIDYEQHADPDDGFSTVPYDKGSNFLLHIERQVGGLKVFRPYIKSYIQKFSGNVVTTEEWRAHLYDFFGKQENGKEYIKKLDEIKWDEWLHGSGNDLPVDMKYDETLAQQCYELANRWKAASEKDDYSEFSPKDMEALTATQRIVFLERMQSMPKFPVSTLNALDKIYKLDSSTNGEVRLRWYGLVLPVGAEYAKSAATWVTDQGRMKMCRTVYRLLYAVAPKLAQDTFKAHESFYHPIARKMIAKDLKLA